MLPNGDGSQDMGYPLGDKPDLPIEERPPPVQDLAATATGTSTIRLTGTVPAEADAVNIQRSTDNTIWSDIDSVASLPYDAINLVDDTQYWFRLWTSNEHGWSVMPSNTATATTDEAVTPDPGDPIFYDDFERYSVGQGLNGVTPPISVNGAKWRHNVGSSCVVGTGGRSGGNCLHFNFKAADDGSDGSDPGHSWCEQKLELCNSAETGLQEVWGEFWINISSTSRAGNSNDKFFMLHNLYHQANGVHSVTYGNCALSWNSWGGDNNRYATYAPSNYSLPTPGAGASFESWGHNHEDGGIPPYGNGYLGNSTTWRRNWEKSANGNPAGATLNAIQSSDAGVWVRHRFHFKANDIGAPNGTLEWWRGNDLILSVPQLQQRWSDDYNKITGAYLLGYFNAGFSSPTTWKIDEVAIYASDPGWSFS